MERITLQVRGLPQEVDVDKAYQYFVRLRNDEAYPVTVVLKSNQGDLVYGVTVPANSPEDVEVTSEFESTGEWEITYTAMKNGVELNSASILDIKEQTQSGLASDRDSPRYFLKTVHKKSNCETNVFGVGMIYVP